MATKNRFELYRESGGEEKLAAEQGLRDMEAQEEVEKQEAQEGQLQVQRANAEKNWDNLEKKYRKQKGNLDHYIKTSGIKRLLTEASHMVNAQRDEQILVTQEDTGANSDATWVFLHLIDNPHRNDFITKARGQDDPLNGGFFDEDYIDGSYFDRDLILLTPIPISLLNIAAGNKLSWNFQDANTYDWMRCRINHLGEITISGETTETLTFNQWGQDTKLIETTLEKAIFEHPGRIVHEPRADTLP